jgi:hypothetical protein
MALPTRAQTVQDYNILICLSFSLEDTPENSRNAVIESLKYKHYLGDNHPGSLLSLQALACLDGGTGMKVGRGRPSKIIIRVG